MWGNLKEIDFCSILRLIEMGQRTGILCVEAHSPPQKFNLGKETKNRLNSWLVFFVNGEIIYAGKDETSSASPSLSRLSDYLRHYRVKLAVEDLPNIEADELNPPEYAYIWKLLAENILEPKQARSIIHNLIQETLFDLNLLRQGSFTYINSVALNPQIGTWQVTPLLENLIHQAQQWQQFLPHIQSPQQFPILKDIPNLRSSLPIATVTRLQQWADGKTNLRQLARYLNRDVVTLAKAIYPYVQQGWVNVADSPVVPAKNSSSNQTLNLVSQSPAIVKPNQLRILCIDNSLEVCQQVQAICQEQGYVAIALNNSLEALSLMFQDPPHLLLCNVAMTELDGYQLCGMLRHSQYFATLPIVLLNDNHDFIHRTRATIVGATDYLTTPFTNQEMLNLLQSHLA
ncbi:response regulator [Calothrix sp. 336/3]|uniref:response regulator n=1 Tax=Calothrix sp. 336/3 TaxID=1337936 RepID=UPI0004E33849|nr:response regulator [Calothrix sp. 336/3]AKG22474.1 chemotaxis protein CheY [Calothrix sp. 336/3]